MKEIYNKFIDVANGTRANPEDHVPRIYLSALFAAGVSIANAGEPSHNVTILSAAYLLESIRQIILMYDKLR